MTPPPALALTLGEPAGIGPDITLVAWLTRQERALPAFFAIGDAAVCCADGPQYSASTCRWRECAPEEAAALFPNALPIVSAGPAVTAAPGHPDETSAPAAARQSMTPWPLVKAGRARAVVTNPISKAVLYADGFAFPGHTEYLPLISRTPAPRPRHDDLVAGTRRHPATIHVPLADVPRLLTRELIIENRPHHRP